MGPVASVSVLYRKMALLGDTVTPARLFPRQRL